MIRSMTGFGRGVSQGQGKEFLVEIKTVNHRYSDIFIKMSRQLTFLEDRIRTAVGKSLSRGKIDIFINYTNVSEDSKSVFLDEELAKAYISSVQLLRDKYELKDDISVSLIARFPDILRVERIEEDEEQLWGLLKTALESAIEALLAMRENEGQKLKTDLLEKTLYMEGVINEIKVRAPEVVKEYKLKLQNRIKDLLEQQTIDEGRLEMEIAIFADRCSIDEEFTRLESHISQVRQTLDLKQPVGRKLDFLVQEMNREINTIGSKANDLNIGKSVVELKSELEKVREQIQNIE